jgi:methyl-accepting chemotaxis protein
MPMAAPDGYKLERKWSLTHFLIGVFGATAILGVMAKIFTFEAEIFGYLLTWKPVVLVGFMGEALVFILMGMMREMRYVPADEEDAQSPSAQTDGEDPKRAPVPELKSAEEELTREAERLAQKIQTIRESLAEELDVLEQFNTLRDNLEEAGDNLSAHSEALGTNMEDLQALYEAQTSIAQSIESVQRELSEESEGLSEEIAETRKAMRTLREQFAQAARRFEQFNQPLSADEPSSNGRDETVTRSLE